MNWADNLLELDGNGAGILQAGSGILAQTQHDKNLENCEADK